MPTFRPDTGRRRWTLIQVASSIALRGGTGAAFPVYAAQAPGCSIWSVPCAARRSSPRVFHKSTDSAAPAFRALPARAAQAARSSTGALSPGAGAARLLPSAVPASASTRASQVRALSPIRVSSPSPRLRWSGACALCLAATLPVDVDHAESQEVFD